MYNQLLPKLSMVAEVGFLYRDKETGESKLIQPEIISPGGYEFIVNEKHVPFDWDAHSGSFNDENHFEFTTGYGFLFNDFNLPDYYDNDLALEGLNRKDLTAEFLSKCDKIEDFYIDFECEGYNEEDVCPIIYSISLINMSSDEVAKGAQAEFTIKDSIIEAYNDSIKELTFGKRGGDHNE